MFERKIMATKYEENLKLFYKHLIEIGEIVKGKYKENLRQASEEHAENIRKIKGQVCEANSKEI